MCRYRRCFVLLLETRLISYHNFVSNSFVEPIFRGPLIFRILVCGKIRTFNNTSPGERKLSNTNLNGTHASTSTLVSGGYGGRNLPIESPGAASSSQSDRFSNQRQVQDMCHSTNMSRTHDFERKKSFSERKNFKAANMYYSKAAPMDRPMTLNLIPKLPSGSRAMTNNRPSNSSTDFSRGPSNPSDRISNPVTAPNGSCTPMKDGENYSEKPLVAPSERIYSNVYSNGCPSPPSLRATASNTTATDLNSTQKIDLPVSAGGFPSETGIAVGTIDVETGAIAPGLSGEGFHNASSGVFVKNALDLEREKQRLKDKELALLRRENELRLWEARLTRDSISNGPPQQCRMNIQNGNTNIMNSNTTTSQQFIENSSSATNPSCTTQSLQSSPALMNVIDESTPPAEFEANIIDKVGNSSICEGLGTQQRRVSTIVSNVSNVSDPLIAASPELTAKSESSKSVRSTSGVSSCERSDVSAKMKIQNLLRRSISSSLPSSPMLLEGLLLSIIL